MLVFLLSTAYVAILIAEGALGALQSIVIVKDKQRWACTIEYELYLSIDIIHKPEPAF